MVSFDALDFDGDDDSVNCGNGTSLQFSCGNMSMLWTGILNGDGVVAEPLLAKYQGSGIGWYVNVALTGIFWKPSDNQRVAINLFDGKIHSIFIAQSGSGAVLCVDGVHIGDYVNCYQNSSTVVDMLIGAEGGNRASMSITEVTVWDNYYSTPDIAKSNTPVSSYVTSGQFDNTELEDSVGENNGTIVGATWVRIKTALNNAISSLSLKLSLSL